MEGGSSGHQQATAHTLAAFCFQTDRLCASRCRLACITSSGKRPSSEALTKCHLQKLDQTGNIQLSGQAVVPCAAVQVQGHQRMNRCSICLFRPADRLRTSRGNSWRSTAGQFCVPCYVCLFDGCCDGSWPSLVATLHEHSIHLLSSDSECAGCLTLALLSPPRIPVPQRWPVSGACETLR